MIPGDVTAVCLKNFPSSSRKNTEFKKIAFIDFDGTIVDKNCVNYLIVLNKHLKSNVQYLFWRSWLQFKGPFFYFLNYLSSAWFDKYFYNHFKGINELRLDEVVQHHVRPYIMENIFPQAEEEIKRLKSEGYYIVIVSGTLRNIIEPVTLELGADDCIATQIHEERGCFTGKVKGYFVNHHNKRRAIEEYCLLHNISASKIVVYGNSKWDIAMFRLAHESYAINPDKKLEAWSKQNLRNVKYWGFEKIPLRFYLLYLFFRPLMKHWEGLKNIPKNNGAIIIANHCSYLDHYVIGLTVMCRYKRRVRFLAKKQHFDSLFQRWIHQFLGAFPIDREKGGKEGLQSVVNLLKKGEIVLIYPEGTRSNDGCLQSFKPGILFTHYQSGCKIIPAGINGAYAILPSHKKIPRPGRITLKFGPAISFVPENGKTTLPRGTERLVMLESLRNEVGQLAGGIY